MIRYLIGDATRPQGDGKKLLIHVCNSEGGWGKGFVLAISKRWKAPEQVYRDAWSMRRYGKSFYLGAVQIVPVEEDIAVANMIAQNGYSSAQKPVALDYRALERCLQTVAFYTKTHGCSLHMPRIGCGLAGSSWENVEPLIIKHLGAYEVTVYDLEQPN